MSVPVIVMIQDSSWQMLVMEHLASAGIGAVMVAGKLPDAAADSSRGRAGIAGLYPRPVRGVTLHAVRVDDA